MIETSLNGYQRPDHVTHSANLNLLAQAAARLLNTPEGSSSHITTYGGLRDLSSTLKHDQLALIVNAMPKASIRRDNALLSIGFHKNDAKKYLDDRLTEKGRSLLERIVDPPPTMRPNTAFSSREKTPAAANPPKAVRTNNTASTPRAQLQHDNDATNSNADVRVPNAIVLVDTKRLVNLLKRPGTQAYLNAPDAVQVILQATITPSQEEAAGSLGDLFHLYAGRDAVSSNSNLPGPTSEDADMTDAAEEALRMPRTRAAQPRRRLL